MFDTTVQVRAIPTPTEIEARVRELRLIDEFDPPVNRRSRSPRNRPWLHLVNSVCLRVSGGYPKKMRGGSSNPLSSFHRSAAPVISR